MPRHLPSYYFPPGLPRISRGILARQHARYAARAYRVVELARLEGGSLPGEGSGTLQSSPLQLVAPAGVCEDAQETLGDAPGIERVYYLSGLPDDL